jgi:hypothetical protein
LPAALAGLEVLLESFLGSYAEGFLLSPPPQAGGIYFSEL